MKEKWEVWLVDDLPSNLKKFKSNHKDHYKIRTFAHPRQVIKEITKGKSPDALLCDVFFYDTVPKAKQAEKIVDKLSKKLKRAATEANASNQADSRISEIVTMFLTCVMPRPGSSARPPLHAAMPNLCRFGRRIAGFLPLE